MPKRKQPEEDIALEDEEQEEEQEDDEEQIDAGSAPTAINPYHILDLPTDASPDDIKKAYRKAALRSHPDKVPPEHKEAAHKQFQEIAFAYAILSDPRRRTRYDTTGRTEDSLDIEDDDFDWTEFFRAQFANVVTEEKISEFEKEYKGSEEERKAVLDAYEKFEGNMGKLCQEVMLSDMVEDEERFRRIIDSAIEGGEVEAYQKYVGESEKQRERRIANARKVKERESVEAGQLEEEIGRKKNKSKGGKKESGGGMGDLAASIQQRQQGRQENFFDHLEAKYAPKGKGKGKAGTSDEPPEEAFATNRRKADVVEGARKKSRTRK